MYLGEQHGKGACDRLFGWTNEWLQRYLQEKPIHGIKDLVQAYRSGSTAMAQMDPSGAAFLCIPSTLASLDHPADCSSTVQL